MTSPLVDAGFLVALYIRGDMLHTTAVDYLRGIRAALLTVAPVIVADQDIDFADAALVWLANARGERRVLTGDETDFSLFRLKSGKRFDLVRWFDKLNPNQPVRLPDNAP